MLLNDRLNKEVLVGKEGGGETQRIRECNKKQIQIEVGIGYPVWDSLNKLFNNPM